MSAIYTHSRDQNLLPELSGFNEMDPFPRKTENQTDSQSLQPFQPMMLLPTVYCSPETPQKREKPKKTINEKKSIPAGTVSSSRGNKPLLPAQPDNSLRQAGNSNGDDEGPKEVPDEDHNRKEEVWMTDCEVYDMIEKIGKALAHVPYAICGMGALIDHGRTERKTTGLSIIVPEESKDVIQSWAVTANWSDAPKTRRRRKSSPRKSRRKSKPKHTQPTQGRGSQYSLIFKNIPVPVRADDGTERDCDLEISYVDSTTFENMIRVRSRRKNAMILGLPSLLDQWANALNRVQIACESLDRNRNTKDKDLSIMRLKLESDVFWILRIMAEQASQHQSRLSRPSVPISLIPNVVHETFWKYFVRTYSHRATSSMELAGIDVKAIQKSHQANQELQEHAEMLHEYGFADSVFGRENVKGKAPIPTVGNEGSSHRGRREAPVDTKRSSLPEHSIDATGLEESLNTEDVRSDSNPYYKDFDPAEISRPSKPIPIRRRKREHMVIDSNDDKESSGQKREKKNRLSLKSLTPPSSPSSRNSPLPPLPHILINNSSSSGAVPEPSDNIGMLIPGKRKKIGRQREVSPEGDEPLVPLERRGKWEDADFPDAAKNNQLKIPAADSDLDDGSPRHHNEINRPTVYFELEGDYPRRHNKKRIRLTPVGLGDKLRDLKRRCTSRSPSSPAGGSLLSSAGSGTSPRFLKKTSSPSSPPQAPPTPPSSRSPGLFSSLSPLLSSLSQRKKKDKAKVYDANQNRSNDDDNNSSLLLFPSFPPSSSTFRAPKTTHTAHNTGTDSDSDFDTDSSDTDSELSSFDSQRDIIGWEIKYGPSPLEKLLEKLLSKAAKAVGGIRSNNNLPRSVVEYEEEEEEEGGGCEKKKKKERRERKKREISKPVPVESPVRADWF